MYSSAHAILGAVVVAICPDPVIGLGLAFASHFLLDYIGESSIGTTKQSALIEGALLLVYLLGCSFTSSPWLFVGAWIAANLPDLIDKPMRWIFKRPEWFSCHNGPGLFQYKGRKLGYPVVYQLTKKETLTINIAAVFAFVVVAYLT